MKIKWDEEGLGIIVGLTMMIIGGLRYASKWFDEFVLFHVSSTALFFIDAFVVFLGFVLFWFSIRLSGYRNKK